MNEDRFVILNARIANTGDAIRGKNIYYHCTKCEDYVHSQPEGSTRCKCRNIAIDVDYVRLHVEDLTEFQVVRKLNE
jgi:hypothetical protein